jgi:hypothetical protein
MALLSFRGIDTPSLQAQGEQRRFSYFNIGRDNSVTHPLPWFVLRHGSVEIGNTTVRLAAVMARRNEGVLSKLPAWAEWSAALEKLRHAFPGVQPSKDDTRDLWLALIAALATPTALADDALSDLWRAAFIDGVVPETLPLSQGPVPLSEVFVTSSPDLARRARTPERIVVTLDEPTLDLWVGRGARNLSQLLEPRWGNSISPAQLLTTAVPELADVLRPGVYETARCQPVSDLRLKLGETAEPVSCLMWRGSLLLDTERLAGCSRAERLRLLLNEIASAGWLTCAPEEALQCSHPRAIVEASSGSRRPTSSASIPPFRRPTGRLWW